MTFPFVSRERLEDAKSRIDKLEKERESLIDRIAVLTGQRPIYGEVAAVPEVAPIDLANYLPISSRKTGLQAVAEGNKAAMERFKSGGIPISVELADAALKGRRDASGR
jgi:hypothetical protein